MELAGSSDRGTVRDENQDRWAARALATGGALLVVADGMGGHPRGAEAAGVALAAVIEGVDSAADPQGALPGAMRSAVESLREMRGDGPTIGTTLVAAVLVGNRMSVANVGDSRAYLLREGGATQITTDHTWVALEVAAGRLDPKLAAAHPARNILARAITGDPVEIDVFDCFVGPGDIVLLCSDGVWGAVEGPRLSRAFSESPTVADAVTRICREALEAGSRDNVTAVACFVHSVRSQAPPAPELEITWPRHGVEGVTAPLEQGRDVGGPAPDRAGGET